MHYLLIISMLLMSGCLRQPDPMMQTLERMEQRMMAIEQQTEDSCRRFGRTSASCQENERIAERARQAYMGALGVGQDYLNRRRATISTMPALQPMKPAQICQGGVDAFGALCLP